MQQSQGGIPWTRTFSRFRALIITPHLNVCKHIEESFVFEVDIDYFVALLLIVEGSGVILLQNCTLGCI